MDERTVGQQFVLDQMIHMDFIRLTVVGEVPSGLFKPPGVILQQKRFFPRPITMAFAATSWATVMVTVVQSALMIKSGFMMLLLAIYNDRNETRRNQGGRVAVCRNGNGAADWEMVRENVV